MKHINFKPFVEGEIASYYSIDDQRQPLSSEEGERGISVERTSREDVSFVLLLGRCDIKRMIILEWARRNEHYRSYLSRDLPGSGHKIILNRAYAVSPASTVHQDIWEFV